MPVSLTSLDDMLLPDTESMHFVPGARIDDYTEDDWLHETSVAGDFHQTHPTDHEAPEMVAQHMEEDSGHFHR